ncbi:MAG TPA: hypothetical protein VJJ26_03920 [Candidatus Babeliales bacterium]|nr:hypothetical protein [Candidatus Babeliales bacterium]
MLRDKQKRISHFLLSLFILMLPAMHMPLHADLTTLAKNDPIPMFTTLNLDDSLLLTREQLLYKFDGSGGRDYDWADKKRNRVNISISPFAQNADRGKTIKGSQLCTESPIPNPLGCSTRVDTPLGDLTGRTNMIALLYNNGCVNTATSLPAGQCLDNGCPNPDAALPGKQCLPPVLTAALNQLFPETAQGSGIRPGLNDEANIDPEERFGFFSFPIKYRKRGLRVEASGLLWYGFGLQLQTGFSTIRQVHEETINLTDEDTFTPKTSTVTEPNVNNFLMEQIIAITDELEIDFCNDFIETSMEDVRFNLFWRAAFPINEDAENTWARFLTIPYFKASGSFSPVKIDNGRHFFAAPFGDNGHASAGLTAGVNLDFLETIEIGGEVGWTHFFKKDYCNMPIPNNEFQNNLFPFSTNVSIQPGENWYFCARLAAYHFLDRLSMHFEWYVLDHQPDHICLQTPDPAFTPEVLECQSSFKVKLGNAGFNYDLSPNFGVGFLWQIPFSQRNAYRSSTIMVGLNVTF